MKLKINELLIDVYTIKEFDIFKIYSPPYL